MYKCELARAAGVSERTLRRWMARHGRELQRLGAGRHAQLLPPGAVRFLCEMYVIDLEDGG